MTFGLNKMISWIGENGCRGANFRQSAGGEHGQGP